MTNARPRGLRIWYKKFGYFLSISQQGVSANIIKNSAAGKIMQYLNHEY
jgi:hypothetical protein